METALFRRARGEFGAFDNRIYILAVGRLVTAAGFAMVIPFMSIYFYQELGMSMSAIGLFFGFSAVLRSAPQPFAGWLSDRLGRVAIMGWSQILRSVTFTGVSYAVISGAGFWTIAALISFNYIFGAVLHPAANAMVADLVKREQRIKGFAMMRVAVNLGWAIGPALGGFIAHRSYGALFFLAAILALLSGLFFLIFLKEVPRMKKTETHAFRPTDIFAFRKDRKLFEHCLISFVLFLAVAQLIAALSVYSVDAIGISRAQLGALYAVNGGMVVFLQYFISHIFRKFKLTSQLAIGSVIYAAGYFLVGLASGFAFLVFCMVIITIAEMIVSPPSVTIVANLSSPEEYGRYMGLFGFFQTTGWSLGPTVGGGLLDFFAETPILMWFSISILGVIAFVLFINFGRRLPGYINSGLKIAEVLHA
jgi:MFS family permease